MFAPAIPGQKSPKSRPHTTGVYSELKQLQQLIMASAKSEDITPAHLAQVTRAYVDAEKLKLQIRMKPAPKPVDVAALDLAKRKRSAPAKGFTETPAEAKGKTAAKTGLSENPPETAS